MGIERFFFRGMLGILFPAPAMLVGWMRRAGRRDEAEAGVGPEGGVERGGRHPPSLKLRRTSGGEERSRCRGPEGGAELRAGWRDSCKRAFYFSPTNGRKPIATGHDFAQLSVMRRRTKRQRSGARVEGAPFGEGPTRSGTATDYGCCVMAMDAGGVTVRTL